MGYWSRRHYFGVMSWRFWLALAAMCSVDFVLIKAAGISSLLWVITAPLSYWLGGLAATADFEEMAERQGWGAGE